MTMFPTPASRHDNKRYALWAYHEKVRRWTCLLDSQHPQLVLDEMTIRQDRVRRSGHPCIFKMLPVGEQP